MVGAPIMKWLGRVGQELIQLIVLIKCRCFESVGRPYGRFQGARRGRRSHAPHFAPGCDGCGPPAGWLPPTGRLGPRGVSPVRGGGLIYPPRRVHPVPARDTPFTSLVKVAGSRCCKGRPCTPWQAPAPWAGSLCRESPPGSPLPAQG